MKKVKLNSKLSFKKETIAKLNDKQMNVIKGGSTPHASSCCVTVNYPCASNPCSPSELGQCGGTGN